MSIKISLPILKSQKELKNTIFYQRNIESIEYKYSANYRLYEKLSSGKEFLIHPQNCASFIFSLLI